MREAGQDKDPTWPSNSGLGGARGGKGGVAWCNACTSGPKPRQEGLHLHKGPNLVGQSEWRGGRCCSVQCQRHSAQDRVVQAPAPFTSGQPGHVQSYRFSSTDATVMRHHLCEGECESREYITHWMNVPNAQEETTVISIVYGRCSVDRNRRSCRTQLSERRFQPIHRVPKIGRWGFKSPSFHSSYCCIPSNDD